MRACILAAGIGQRLRPLTDDKPKALVEVNGLSFLERLLAQLEAVGVTEVVVATGWHEDAVEAALAGSRIAWKTRRNDHYDTTQNSVSLHACADALMNGGPQDLFKLDGDVIVDVDVFRRLMQKQRETGADLIAAIDPHHRGERSSIPGTEFATRGSEFAHEGSPLGAEEMKVTTEGDRITAFGKHLDPKACSGESIGVELISAAGLSSIVDALGALVTRGVTDLYYEDVYARLIASRRIDARAVDVGDLPWTEVDTPDDLSRASEIARRTRLA